MTANRSETPGGLVRAKRLFAANLILFAALVAVGLFSLGGGSDDAPDGAPASETIEKDPPDPRELAYLKGQAAALGEHPGTMPPFEEAWVREVCRKRLLRDVDFAEVPEDAIEPLVEAYYRGYAERFEDYYDTRHARASGYAYGLRFDPKIHPFHNDATLREILTEHESKLRARYDLDEPGWLRFVEAFGEGYRAGYFAIEDGVTADSGTDIRVEFE